MGKLVYGVGVYEAGVYTTRAENKMTKEYSLWTSMLRRCYSDKWQLRQPAYIGCSVSEDFKNFQYFAEWCQHQVGFKMEDYQLDKDIISKGNQLYSEGNCFFVPRSVNNLLTKANKIRGLHPIGTSYCSREKKFIAQCCNGKGGCKSLGYHNTPEEAFQAYKAYKESLAKQLAKEYEGLVHPKVIEALNNYVVEITD